MKVEESDVIMFNGKPMQFVDVTMIEMGYYPVWKHMSKYGKRQHRLNSAVNVVRRARKLRSRKSTLKRFAHAWLLSNINIIPTKYELRVELGRGLEKAMRKRYPWLTDKFEVSV